jgi:hypothetical protein
MAASSTGWTRMRANGGHRCEEHSFNRQAEDGFVRTVKEAHLNALWGAVSGAFLEVT